MSSIRVTVPARADTTNGDVPATGKNGLVTELSTPEFGHPVKACDDTYERLRDKIMCVGRGHLASLVPLVVDHFARPRRVHVEFTGTKGGTSLVRGCLELTPGMTILVLPAPPPPPF
jgi:hypothetical protein